MVLIFLYSDSYEFTSSFDAGPRRLNIQKYAYKIHPE